MNSPTMRSLVCSIIPAILVLLGMGLASAQEPDRISEKAIYRPDVSLINEIRDNCGKGPSDFYSCYRQSLQRAGATNEALAFVTLLDEPGFMRNFKKIGPVDIAFADFPFRANENQGCFLVNGNPRFINVDDLSAIKSDMLEKNPEYMKLRNKYPDISLWMGNRSGNDFVKTVRLKNGGVRFSLLYRLTEGCRACKDVGDVRVGFDFDSRGTFSGRKILAVRAIKQE